MSGWHGLLGAPVPKDDWLQPSWCRHWCLPETGELMIRCSLRENRERMGKRTKRMGDSTDFRLLQFGIKYIHICRICRRAREIRFGRMFFPNWRDWTLTGGFRCTAQHADIFDVWRHHSLDLLRRASHHWYGDARAWGCPWLIIVYRCCPECGAG